MPSALNVALVGATGNLGSAILPKLLKAGFHVTILSREGSTSTSQLASHPNQTIKFANFESKDSLISALSGTDAVVSTITTTKVGDQNTLIDAALATGTVTRFIPSDFGSDIFHPQNIHLPVFAGKVATAKYIEEVAEANPHFSYTSIMNNIFFDWCIKYGLIVDAKNHTATLWNGGDVPFSTTRLSAVADAVVTVLKTPEQFKNKTVKIKEAVVTQNQIISIIKRIDGKEWTTTVKTTEEAEKEGYEEMQKGNFRPAMINFLMPAVWGPGREVYASQTESELLGVKELTTAEVEAAVKEIILG